MKVLVACEESQRTCTAFREKGHEAYSCDIQECSGGHPEWHIQEDALEILRGGCEFFTADGAKHHIEGRWDLIIAHPPCTYLTNASAVRMRVKGQIQPERYAKAMEAKRFFMAFLNADCEKICVENPVPLKIVDLPPYSQIIEPWMFGEPWSKKTYLWEFGVPHLMPTEIVAERKPFLPSGTGRKLRGDTYGAKGCAHDGKPRAKTFPGIAKAMAEQWG